MSLPFDSTGANPGAGASFSTVSLSKLSILPRFPSPNSCQCQKVRQRLNHKRLGLHESSAQLDACNSLSPQDYARLACRRRVGPARRGQPTTSGIPLRTNPQSDDLVESRVQAFRPKLLRISGPSTFAVASAVPPKRHRGAARLGVL
jgi:hypothetical protein